MAKKRKPILDYTLYLVVRVFVCFVQTLTWDGARAVARVLAFVAYRTDKRHCRVARDNLRQAFPGRYTNSELERMVRGVFRHFAGLLTEIILIPRKLHVTNHKNHLEIVNKRELLDALLSERPLLIVTCHFGNWELAGYYLGLCGFTTHAIARTLDNRYLDRYLRQFRERTGQAILAKRGDFDNIMEVLAGGGVMATLGDQDAGKRGVFVDFFGRSASTHKAIALMALEHQVPIIVSAAYKVGEPLHYRIVADEKILPEDYADNPDAVRAITQRFTNSVERLIRQAPEQYFWLHNRWKSQPKKRQRKAAA